MYITNWNDSELHDDESVRVLLAEVREHSTLELPQAHQQIILKPIMQGRNVLVEDRDAVAESLNFLLISAVLQNIQKDVSKNRAIVLAPCRELIYMIASWLKRVCEPHNIRVITCVGGYSIKTDIEAIQKGFHVLVGSPGRVVDMIRRNLLSFPHTMQLSMIEAENIFSCGYGEFVQDIVNTLPSDSQILVFCGDREPSIVSFQDTVMKDAIYFLHPRSSTGGCK